MKSKAATLRSNDIAELMWDCVSTTIIDDYTAKHVSVMPSGRMFRFKKRYKNKGSRNSEPTDQAKNLTWNTGGNSESAPDIAYTVRAVPEGLKATPFDPSNGDNSHL